MNFQSYSGAWASPQNGTKTEDVATLEGVSGTTDQSGAPLCACRLINVAHTGVDKLSLQYDVFQLVY